MGGRGGSSGIRATGGGKGGRFGGIENATVSEFAYVVKYGGYTADKLKRSPGFVRYVSDAISKKAFDQGKEITKKQLNESTNRVIDKLGEMSEKVTQEMKKRKK